MKKNYYKVLGIMSGTSLDGIDLAYLNFHYHTSWNFQIIKSTTKEYPSEWKKRLSQAINLDDAELNNLNLCYTKFLSGVISEFIDSCRITDLDAVCSHGHTIKHEPQNGYTLQIGNLPELAKMIQQKVVCDFRVQDVKLGGQGAPLVPIGDELLFSEYEACLNLGGFANISLRRKEKRIAFDICPVNTVLNFLAEKLHLSFDKDGKIAASGNLDHQLLKNLNELEFYHLVPPKSLGIEWVNQNILPLLENSEEIPDVIHTFSIHAATQIAVVLEQNSISSVLVTGGGTYNKFLIQEVEKRTKAEIIIPTAEIINYKEALIFGFLGVLRLRNENNILSSVTGASGDHSSGEIYLP